jgi:hypothetical protein
MNIELKDMKLTMEVNIKDCTLRRYVSDMKGNIIWDSGVQDSNEVDNSKEGLDAWESQMTSMPFWKIVEVERVVV